LSKTLKGVSPEDKMVTWQDVGLYSRLTLPDLPLIYG